MKKTLKKGKSLFFRDDVAIFVNFFPFLYIDFTSLSSFCTLATKTTQLQKRGEEEVCEKGHQSPSLLANCRHTSNVTAVPEWASEFRFDTLSLSLPREKLCRKKRAEL